MNHGASFALGIKWSSNSLILAIFTSWNASIRKEMLSLFCLIFLLIWIFSHGEYGTCIHSVVYLSVWTHKFWLCSLGYNSILWLFMFLVELLPSWPLVTPWWHPWCLQTSDPFCTSLLLALEEALGTLYYIFFLPLPWNQPLLYKLWALLVGKWYLNAKSWALVVFVDTQTSLLEKTL